LLTVLSGKQLLRCSHEDSSSRLSINEHPHEFPECSIALKPERYHEPLAPPPPENPPPNEPPENPPPEPPDRPAFDIIVYSKYPIAENTPAHSSHAQPFAPRRKSDTALKIAIPIAPTTSA